MKVLAPEELKGQSPKRNIFSFIEITKRAKHLGTFNRTVSKKNLGRFIAKDEIASLSNKWASLANKTQDLIASGYLLILDNGKYAELTPDQVLPAASSIKIPILIATLEMVDSKQIQWNEELKLTEEVLAGEAGWMALNPIGTSFPIHRIATEMIRISDNTATNLLIKRIGGKEILNRRFKALGLTSTQLNNWLPDLKGTNTTSTKDLTRAIALVETGSLLTPRTRDLFREVMSTSRTNRLLPGGLLKGLNAKTDNPDYTLQIKGYRVLNKTGDIGISYADAGLIEMPDNTRAVAGFIVKGPFNDPRSTRLIRQMAAAMAPALNPENQFSNN